MTDHTAWGCQECATVAATLAEAETHADQTGHILVRGDVVEPERVGPVGGDLTGVEISVLRMAAQLAATGVPYTDQYLADRTVSARGIYPTNENRNRYATIVANLIGSGHLRGSRSGVLGWDDYSVTVTARGRRALDQHEHGHA